MKKAMTISIEEEVKARAEVLAEETGYNQSLIIELLLKGTSKEEILDLYRQSRVESVK